MSEGSEARGKQKLHDAEWKAARMFLWKCLEERESPVRGQRPMAWFCTGDAESRILGLRSCRYEEFCFGGLEDITHCSR